MYGDNVQNRVLKIVNDYNYSEDVERELDKYKETFKSKSGETVNLNFYVSNPEYRGSNTEEVSQKIAEKIIEYKIKEKIFMKLMAEGFIYPVSTCDGYFGHHIRYQIGNSTTTMTLNFRRIVFNEFMKV